MARASSIERPRRTPAADRTRPLRGPLPWLVILVIAVLLEAGPFNMAHWRTANLGSGTTIPLAQAQVGAGLSTADTGLSVTTGPTATGSPGIDAPTTMAAATAASAQAAEAQATVTFPLPGTTAVRTITIGIDGPAPVGWRGNAVTVQTRTTDGQWRDISQQMWLDHTALGAPQRLIVYGSGDATRRITLHVPDTDAVRLVVLGPVGSPVRLSGITVNAAMPFSFNPLRFLAVAALLAVLWAFRPGSRLYAIAVGAGRGAGRGRGLEAHDGSAAGTRGGAGERTRSRADARSRSARHRLPSTATIAMTALAVIESAVFVAVAFASWRGGAYTGIFRSEALGHWVNRDEYALLADALLHGRTWVDLPVDPQLTALPDPYDYSARRSLAEQGVSMYWDYAYFQGHYYVYFGVLPALMLFAPVKALTGHDLPTPVAVMILGVAAIALMCALVLLIARRWFAGRVSIGMTLLLAAGVTIGSNVYYMARVPSLYSVPIIMSLALTLGALICWMLAKRGAAVEGAGLADGGRAGARGNGRRAHRAGAGFAKRRPHAGWLAAGSLLMACNLVSRPQFLAFAILGIPMFWNEIVHERSVLAVKGRDPLLATIATLLPFLVVGAFLAAYNQARFGSPTDLGALYNFSGYDLRTQQPSLSLMPAMMFINWLQPANIINTFPFVATTDFAVAAPTEPSLGGVFVQFPLGLLAFGLWWARGSLRRRGDGVLGTTVALAAAAVLVSVVDFAICGVNNRYDCDFAFAPVLVAAIVAMCVDARGAGADAADAGAGAGASFASAGGVVASALNAPLANAAAAYDGAAARDGAAQAAAAPVAPAQAPAQTAADAAVSSPAAAMSGGAAHDAAAFDKGPSQAVRAFRALVLALVMISVLICVFGWFATGRLSPWISTNPNLYASFAAWFGM